SPRSVSGSLSMASKRSFTPGTLRVLNSVSKTHTLPMPASAIERARWVLPVLLGPLKIVTMRRAAGLRFKGLGLYASWLVGFVAVCGTAGSRSVSAFVILLYLPTLHA